MNIDGDDEDKDLSGIKAAVQAARGGRGKSRAVGKGGDDWDLEGGDKFVEDREGLPVIVVLNTVCQTAEPGCKADSQVPGSDAIFLDATPQEESACPDRLLLFFTGAGKLCGMRIEGSSGLDIPRIPALLTVSRPAEMQSFADCAGGQADSDGACRRFERPDSDMISSCLLVIRHEAFVPQYHPPTAPSRR